MIDKKTLVLALSLFLGSPALAQDPPADEGRDGLAQGVPWNATPRGDAVVEPPPPPPVATSDASAEDADEGAALARFVLDFAERRVQKLDEVLAPAAESQAPPVVDLRERVKELKKQLRRAGSTCPVGYGDFVRKVLPFLEEAEQRASALTKTQGVLAEAARTLQVQGGTGRALAREGDSLSAPVRALLAPQLAVARDALAGAREAIKTMDLERVRAGSARAERAFEDARSIVRNSRRTSGPGVQ